MDPFLEGELWPDVHHSLATKLRNMLAPSLHPKYVARLELYTVLDEHPEEEVGIDIWAIDLPGPLPSVPVPLQAPDPDLAIGLGAALQEIYDEAFYGASIDYSKAPPPPDIREAFAGWMQELLAAYKR